MKKKTITIVAIGTAVVIAATAFLIVGGLAHVHAEDAAKVKSAASKAELLSHMKHWSGYERLLLKPEKPGETSVELQAASADSAAAGNDLSAVATQWITKAETKKIAPILFKGGVILSVKAVDDPIIYRWTVLSLASVCQSIFDGQTKPSTVTTVVNGSGKKAALEARLTNANNAAVQVICPELF